MGALILFTVFCMVVARILGANAKEDDRMTRNDTMQRIGAVGQVRTTAEEPAAVVVAAAPQSADEIVQTVCAGCHISGVANAPKLDDTAAWAQRRELGLETLVASVINGKGAMAARAGTNLSDEELTAAVKLMAGFEDDSSSEGESSAAADTSSGTEDSETATPSDEDASAEDASATDEEATPAENTDAESTTTEETTVTENTASEDSDAAATESSSATGTSEAATATAGSSTLVAAELTDRVKGVADSVCAACHIAGVANAPKLGDKEAWAKRAEKGLEAQIAVVAKGLGVMPPRGGSDLSDEELGAAIQYMMSK